LHIKSISEYVDALVNAPRFKSQVKAHHRRPSRPGCLCATDGILSNSLSGLLKRLGIERLYRHQCEALSAIEEGNHTVVATDTASGKSLIYNLAMLRAYEIDAQARALYVFPLKALAQDQLATFDRWAAQMSPSIPDAAIYDGDTTDYQRKKIRQHPPNVLMTNPEMVHLSLLPFHDRWHAFFAHLQLVVIDEVHTYRGMLGNHMAQILRRLIRICRHHGASPLFIFTSATVNNPSQLASALVGLPVHAVTDNGAPSGERHIVLMDPENRPAFTAIALLKAALARELRTIVYTQSRKLAELVSVWSREQSGQWRDRISVYRAGLMPHNRREIEHRLKNGELLAVVSTSALELGIDIGDLDLCILIGYPGSMISTWQRSGRVGRQGQPSALIMIATENAIDKYYVAHPEAFYRGKAEAAVLNAYNGVALRGHLVCAAAELPLDVDESWLQVAEVNTEVARLEHSWELKRSADGIRLHSQATRPHRRISLRGSGERYQIIDAATDRPVGEIDGHRVYRDTHPGAIYLHQGRTYRIETVDDRAHCVRLLPVEVDYYTRVRSVSDVEIIRVQDSKAIGWARMFLGEIRMTETVFAYDMIQSANGRTLKQIPFDAPPVSFETQGIWIDIPGRACRELQRQPFDLLGALHAAEHAAISMLPLLVLADRNDVGGLSTAYHPQTGNAAIFIYDGVPGGAGFSEQVYLQAAELMDITIQAIERCPCEAGCPACVHSPKCGSGNHPIDKAGAAALLRIIRRSPERPGTVEPSVLTIQPPNGAKPDDIFRHPESFGVFDLETQRSAAEVGGWHMAHLMRISCGVVYDSQADQFSVYTEDQIESLIAHLKRLDLVIGFNSKRFDYKVLTGYSRFDFWRLPGYDILESVKNRLGYRLSLDHLAEATLGARKSASGLDALRWWRQGRIEKIIDYCQMDVRLTRDLYLFARENGYLMYRDRDGVKFRVPLGASP